MRMQYLSEISEYTLQSFPRATHASFQRRTVASCVHVYKPSNISYITATANVAYY